MLILACVAQTQRKVLAARPFSLACFLAAIWSVAATYVLQAPTLDQKLLALKLGFTIVSFLPLISLETVYRFVYERRLFVGWMLVAGLIIPAITAVLAWTINITPIFRYDCWLDTSGPVPLLRFKNGPWNIIFFAYCYGLAFWSFYFLLASIRSAPPWVRRARIIFVFARLIPLVFDLIYQLKIFSPVGVNYAPASMAISSLLVAYLLFGDRIGYHAYVAHSSLVERISDLLVVLDRKRRVLDINRAAAEALDVKLESVLGRPAEALFESWKAMLPHLGDSPNTTSEIEWNGQCYELTILPVDESAGNKGDMTILWLRNVTARKKAERGYVAAADAAKKANEAKDRYLAVMSHEIRNPLNSVLGFMRLLEKTRLDGEQHEYIGHTLRSGDSLLALINEILDFSKIEAGRITLAFAPFNLRDEVNSLCEAMKREADAKGVAFRWDIDSQIPPAVVGDKLRVSQILRNLIANALKFTQEGGVSVRVEYPKSSHSASECVVRFVIEDTGIGIASHDIGSLFQAFSQASSSIQHRFGGTGLGLVIAKRFSELMGGTITVESALGRGSTFTCTIQLGIGKVLAPRERLVVESRAARKLKVLVVDDQSVNRRLLQIMLGHMGHENASATDGFECLAVLEKKAFDVIIVDIEMPGMDGFELARRIRAADMPFSQPYLIALTAHTSPGIREQCFSAGMNAYLSKPISPRALDEALAIVEEPEELEPDIVTPKGGGA